MVINYTINPCGKTRLPSIGEARKISDNGLGSPNGGAGTAQPWLRGSDLPTFWGGFFLANDTIKVYSLYLWTP